MTYKIVSMCWLHRESTGSKLPGKITLNYKMKRTMLDYEKKGNYLIKRNNYSKTLNFKQKKIQNIKMLTIITIKLCFF